MKKEKKKKEFVFNPADYDYMDNMPLKGWIWEFIRRNSGYKNLYSEFKKFPAKTVLTATNRPKEMVESFVKNFFISQERYCIIPNIVDKKFPYREPFFLIAITKSKDFIYIPNPDKKYRDFHNTEPIIRGLNIVSYYKFDDHLLEKYKDYVDAVVRHATENASLNKFNEHCTEIIQNKLLTTSIKDTLYLGISTKAKIEDIERELKLILKQHVKSRKRKVRIDKWKYYFITYDLKRSGRGYSEIADILGKTYPFENPDKIFSEKNIEYYYKSALSLINGEYSKYLYL